MKHEVVTMRSGVQAMRSTDTGELMHPGTGPLIEARTLYVEQSRLRTRLEAAPADEPFVLFDVGLGAASNAIAAWNVSAALGRDVARLHIVSFENDLGALELALEHGAAFGLVGEAGAAARALVKHGIHETGRTTWQLRHGDVLGLMAEGHERAQTVYWDPFSPRANPDLWTVAAFTAVRRQAGPDCTLFTYSASTRVRIALLLAGWAVGRGAPTGNKEHTTAAAVKAEDLRAPLQRAWLARLERPDVPLPADVDHAQLARLQDRTQFL